MTLCSELKNNLFKNLLLDSEYPGNSKEFCSDQKVYFVHLVPTLCGLFFTCSLEESHLCRNQKWAIGVSPSVTVS